MSEPKRYIISGLHPHIIESKDGFMVYYEDYARLKAEVDNLRKSADINTDKSTHELSRLKAEVERLTAFTTRTIIPNEVLQAQVERLTKAGDAMAKRTEFFQKRWDSDELCQEVEAWNAAKEGKQL